DRHSQQGLIARYPLHTPAAAAVPLKQLSECPDQELALVEGVTVLLERAMESQEPLDEIGIAEQILGEIGHGLDAELGRQGIDRGLGEIERAVAPAPAPAHPARVRLVRIEDKKRGTVRFLDTAAALDDGAALLGDRDHEGLVRMRRILVGREVRAHEAE